MMSDFFYQVNETFPTQPSPNCLYYCHHHYLLPHEISFFVIIRISVILTIKLIIILSKTP